MIGIVSVLETKDSVHESFYSVNCSVTESYLCMAGNKELIINDLLNELAMSETALSLYQQNRDRL